MPRYSFRTTVGSAPARDEGRFMLDDLDAAKRRADEIRAAEMKAEPRNIVTVEVRDETGRHVHTIIGT